MKITLTFDKATREALEGLTSALTALQGGQAAAPAAPAEPAKPAEPAEPSKGGGKKGGKQEPAKPAEAPDPLEGGDEAPEVTKDDVKAALRTFMEAQGREETIALLNKYDAANINALKPEHYADVVAEAKAASGK